MKLKKNADTLFEIVSNLYALARVHPAVLKHYQDPEQNIVLALVECYELTIPLLAKELGLKLVSVVTLSQTACIYVRMVCNLQTTTTFDSQVKNELALQLARHYVILLLALIFDDNQLHAASNAENMLQVMNVVTSHHFFFSITLKDIHL